MTHTPGPWCYRGNGYYVTTLEAFTNGPKFGQYKMIADLENGPWDVPQPELDANARLIASAPDLLDAILSLLNTEGPATAAAQAIPAFKGFDAKHHYDKARAVLAKINDT